MKSFLKKLRVRSILTICAEIATIFSFILAFAMYRSALNETINIPSLNYILIIFIIVNIIMFVALSFTIFRNAYLQFNSKEHQLAKKVEEFLNSNSRYLYELKTTSIDDFNKLIERSKNALKKLSDNRAFDEDVYYMLLYSLFDCPDGNINVVSILDENEWVQTPEEDEFLRVNLALAEKKIHLNRIFVVGENEVSVKLNNKSIQSFIEADHTYIHLFVVFQNKLSRSMLNNIGSGFIEFYRFVVACDIFEDNEIRGTLKFDVAEVELYNKIYMQLSEHYLPLNSDFTEKYFAQNPSS